MVVRLVGMIFMIDAEKIYAKTRCPILSLDGMLVAMFWVCDACFKGLH